MLARAFAVSLLMSACSAPRPPAGETTPSPAAPAAEAKGSQPEATPEQAASGPLRGAARFLKGQTHVHTGRSYDAKTPPDEVLRFYAERGYDFVAITDHNRITVVEPPAGLLLVPGAELTQNSVDCEPKPTPGYRCLFHTSALFVEPELDRARGERFDIPYRSRRLAAYSYQLGMVRDLGGTPVLNHPLFHFAADAKLVRELASADLKLVELFNASVDRQNPRGREQAEQRAERFWDEILSSGTLVYGLATDDSHHFSDAAQRRRVGKFAYEGDRAWIMVRAEKSLASIERALGVGDFYATTGVVLAELERSASLIRLRIEAPASSGFVTRFIGSGGRELAKSEGLEARYVPTGKERYVRAVVLGPSGTKAWVQPTLVP